MTLMRHLGQRHLYLDRILYSLGWSQTPYVAKGNFELLILQHSPPKCWVYSQDFGYLWDPAVRLVSNSPAPPSVHKVSTLTTGTFLVILCCPSLDKVSVIDVPGKG